MKTLAIVNPAAGGGSCGNKAAAVLDSLRDGGLSLEVVETTKPGHAVEIAREGFANGHRNFLAVGGDGTSCELVNGFLPISMEQGEKVTLGFLPLGTGNSFLRDFTTEGEKGAIDAIRSNRSQPCDVNALHHTKGTFYSLNILSMGFTAEVGSLTNRRFKALGELGYVCGVVGTLLRLKPQRFRLTIDGTKEKERALTFLSINNSQFTGGKMQMAPHARTNDGKAALIEALPMSRFQLLRTFPKIFEGTHTKASVIEAREATQIEFRDPEELDVMADGEIIRLVPTKLEVVPDALHVMV